MRFCIVGSPRILAPVKPGNPLYVQTYGLANSLAELGHDVDVIALPSKDKTPEKYTAHEVGRIQFSGHVGNIVTRILNELIFSLGVINTLHKLFKDNRPDAVIFDASIPSTFFSLLFTGKHKETPFIFRYGGPVPGISEENNTQIYSKFWHEPKIATNISLFLQSYVFKRVSQVAVMSGMLRDTFLKYFKLEPEKLSVIHPGVDTAWFRPGIDTSELRAKYKISKQAPIVACVAKIAPYKNQMVLMQAIPQILEKHSDAVFMFAGPISSHKYHLELQDYIKQQSLEDRIIFTGSIVNTDLPMYYSLCDVFVLPSLAEGLPGVLIEAMSCGKAAVASSIPQCREVAKKGDEVTFIDPLNPASIAESINRLLDSPGDRQKMGENARSTVVEHFDWKVIATKIAEISKQ